MNDRDNGPCSFLVGHIKISKKTVATFWATLSRLSCFDSPNKKPKQHRTIISCLWPKFVCWRVRCFPCILILLCDTHAFVNLLCPTYCITFPPWGWVWHYFLLFPPLTHHSWTSLLWHSLHYSHLWIEHHLVIFVQVELISDISNQPTFLIGRPIGGLFHLHINIRIYTRNTRQNDFKNSIW